MLKVVRLFFLTSKNVTLEQIYIGSTPIYSPTHSLPPPAPTFILTGDVEGYPESVCWYSEGLRRDGGEIRPPYLDSRISSDG